MNKIIKFLVLGGVIFLCGKHLEGITTTGGYLYAVTAAIVLAIVNSFIRPILAVLTFPITVFSFGIFSFVLTALMVTVMDYFVDHVYIASFWNAMLLGLIVSFASSALDKFLSRPKRVYQPEAETRKYTDYEEVD